MEPIAFLGFLLGDHVETELIGLMDPGGEFFLPSGLLGGYLGRALRLGCIRSQGAPGQALGEFSRGCFGITANANCYFLYQT